jgi:hypothetical protein
MCKERDAYEDGPDSRKADESPPSESPSPIEQLTERASSTLRRMSSLVAPPLEETAEEESDTVAGPLPSPKADRRSHLGV